MFNENLDSIVAGIAKNYSATEIFFTDPDKHFPNKRAIINIIKDLRAPLPNLEIIPVGGVNAENLAGWLQAGAFACGIGGSLLAGIGEGDLARITRTARTLTDIVKGCCHAR